VLELHPPNDPQELPPPPFIPPTLETLQLNLQEWREESRLPVLPYLPAMIESSGARLRSITLFLPGIDDIVAPDVAALLRACSLTLEVLELVVCGADLAASAGPRAELLGSLAGCGVLRELMAPKALLKEVKAGRRVLQNVALVPW
jgi:hypothetical protein